MRRGYFQVGVYHPKHTINTGTLWRSAFILGANGIFTIGSRCSKRQHSDTVKAWRHVPLTEYDCFDDFKQSLPYDCKLIAVEISSKSVRLEDFRHPERACYLLGAEDYGVPEDILSQCNSIVQLPGEYCLNVSVAGSILMYDRLTKTEKTICTNT